MFFFFAGKSMGSGHFSPSQAYSQKFSRLACCRRSSPSLAAVAGWTVAAVLLQVAGLSLFLYGFFPVKPTLRGPHCLSDFFNSI
jgi:hypothetical protein